MSLEERLHIARKQDDEALVATVTFFRALRREWSAQNRGGECPVPDWSAIEPMDRQRFIRSMKAAMASAKPDNLVKVIDAVRAL